MAKTEKIKIDRLVPDNRNFNKGTQYGDHLMDESLRQFGLGRSILIDRNNRIIAGNKTTEKAGELGFDDVLVVETDGRTLVAVKRTDIDLDSKAGRELALADNATAKANLDWDEEAIAEAAKAFEFDPNDWGVDLSLGDEDSEDEEDSPKKEISTRLIVECKDVTKLSMLYSELQDRGFEVELKE
ncbi:MAG: hypothetical protein NC110_00145 [Ruminococcus sp.]|nr:hypothetical protein [Ruminococcus sp.]